MTEELLPGFAPGEQEHIAYLFEAWRARRALEEAPDILAHVRSLVTDSDGRVEPGADWRELSSPLRITPADAADELYAELVNWAIYWAEALEQRPPAAAVAWSNLREVQGFRAGTSPEGALMLARVQTMWLLARHDRITDAEYGPRYIEDITASIWRLRSRFPMHEPKRPERPVDARECPLCKGRTVDVHWYSENDQDRPAVLCSLCGWMPENERQTLRVLREVVS